jgi:hypothetical protein
MADAMDHQIASLINQYIEQARKEIRQEGVDLIEKAFTSIQGDRQNGCLSDELYSSAEHYLTARHLASHVTPGATNIASLIYDGAKIVAGPKQVQKAGLGNQCPASEWTARQTKWKFYGAKHGGLDMLLRSSKIPPVRADGMEREIILGF